MLRLQEKAHMSLDDFRKGKGSPISRYSAQDPQSPVDEDDELAMLGGKSRLVKKEPSSPAPHQPFSKFACPRRTSPASSHCRYGL